MKKSFLFLAPGFEEVEALTPVDVMRRAGMDVTTVSILTQDEVAGAHGVGITADTQFADCDFSDAEWLILPGGMPGAVNLAAFEPLNDLLLAHHNAGGKIAAICAAPAVVLGPLGLLDGKKFTCYPGFESGVPEGLYQSQRVVSLPDIVTANGPSSALLFALSLVAATKGEKAANEVGTGMLLEPQTF